MQTTMHYRRAAATAAVHKNKITSTVTQTDSEMFPPHMFNFGRGCTSVLVPVFLRPLYNYNAVPVRYNRNRAVLLFAGARALYFNCNTIPGRKKILPANARYGTGAGVSSGKIPASCKGSRRAHGTVDVYNRLVATVAAF
jgi:hypothetical protein